MSRPTSSSPSLFVELLAFSAIGGLLLAFGTTAVLATVNLLRFCAPSASLWVD